MRVELQYEMNTKSASGAIMMSEKYTEHKARFGYVEGRERTYGEEFSIEVKEGPDDPCAYA